MRKYIEIENEIMEFIKKEDNFSDLCDILSQNGLISETVYEMHQIEDNFTIKELLSHNLSNFDINDYYFVYDDESCVSFCDRYEYYSSIHTVNEIFQILKENWSNCLDSYTDFGKKIRQLFEEYEKSLKLEERDKNKYILSVLTRARSNLYEMEENLKQFDDLSDNFYFPEEVVAKFGNCSYIDYKKMKNDLIVWCEKTKENICDKIDEISKIDYEKMEEM